MLLNWLTSHVGGGWITIVGGLIVIFGSYLTLMEGKAKDKELTAAQQQVIDLFTGRGGVFYFDFANSSVGPQARFKIVGKNPVRDLSVEVINLLTLDLFAEICDIPDA